MKIVFDVMGGDHAPEVTVAGAIDAAKEFGIPIVLVGQEAIVRGELAKHDWAGLNLSIVDAPEVVDMHDKPAEVLRS
ncbi:MAG: phosphate--acyl-ACP acyltransferase, partial [Anaerolineae bacterium]|nr:phosphate--acyl-ACP acyltransferase [Anaerolineae bacterium]